MGHMPLYGEMLINLTIFILCAEYCAVTKVSMSSVGEKALEACRRYGQTMLECHNILYPSQKIRVPIDLLLYPHMVLIGFRRDAHMKPAWKCGGSLIR